MEMALSTNGTLLHVAHSVLPAISVFATALVGATRQCTAMF